MKANLLVNKNFVIGDIDPRIYGSFIEHLGRAVYGGIYEPTHPTADADGMRGDVLELVRRLGVPVVRYPGGNFVSGYNWEDGVGDKKSRPRKLDLAWESIEPNEVGTDEFALWAKKAESEVMMAVNLGTRGVAEAIALLEYCNGEKDTYYANMRRENGFEKPHGVKLWCLGNEMDGPWQTCAKTAREYGRLAREAAKAMKTVDPSVELVACGSSSYNMPTFGEWEYTVLDEAYGHIDYISMHQYYNNVADSFADYMGRGAHLDGFIKSVVAICDAVKGKKHSSKTVNVSLDEWNAWYHSHRETRPKWTVGPAILEDVYTFEDALLVGSLLITIHNNCDRVKIACLAQLVNVIAPIMTENGGAAWAQTIFYPFALASANGRGTALKTVIDCESYKTSDGFTVPYLSASVIRNSAERKIILFVTNLSREEDMDLELTLEGFDTARLAEWQEVFCEDLKATNTKDLSPVTAKSVAFAPCDADEKHSVVLKKHSFNMLVFKY